MVSVFLFLHHNKRLGLLIVLKLKYWYNHFEYL